MMECPIASMNKASPVSKKGKNNNILSLLSNRRISEETKQSRRNPKVANADSSQKEVEQSLLEPLQVLSTAPEAVIPNVAVLGFDISSLDPNHQFAICAGGTFGFTLLYGTLQELVIVHIAGRKLSFFLAACQFLWFTIWSLLLVSLRQRFHTQKKESTKRSPLPAESVATWSRYLHLQFVCLALIRALDVTVSNMSMKYLNYPARTLIKSSRVVFTMMLGVVIQNKRYKFQDYFAVAFLVLGLAVFLHADFTSNAIFNPIGVLLLILSLTCDGVTNNWSEKLMNQHDMTQDDYHLRLYSLSFGASLAGAIIKKELWLGIHHFFLVPGTISEIEGGSYGRDPPTWSVPRKMIVFCLLYMTGLFGGSCLGAINRRFGALAMTLTSTTRKAATMFVSFSLFAHNTCTSEHLLGIALYILSLLLKGLNKASRRREDKIRATPSDPSKGITTRASNKQDDIENTC